MIGRIYKIMCKEDKDFIYIGSTILSLNKRWNKHKSDYKRWKEGKKKNNISTHEYYDKYNIENFSIELIKEYKVCDEKHLKVYEQLWINKSKCVNIINSFHITYLSQKEYREKNKEVISKKKKKYNEKNKEVISKKNKEYREKNKKVISKKKKVKITCKCGSIVRKDNLSIHKKTKKHIQYENL